MNRVSRSIYLFSIILLAAGGVLVAVAVVSAVATGMIERRYPPAGRFIRVDGGRLHIVELGRPDAPTVVMLHGASGNLGDLRLALGEKLSKRYRLILVDRPGHGWSARVGGRDDSSPGRQAALIHEAISQIGVKRTIVLGHSLSGAVATAYALAYPGDVTGVVLLAPVTHPWPGGVGWINSLVTTPLIGPLVARTIILPLGYFLLPTAVDSVFAPQSPPQDYVVRTGTHMILRPAEFVANAQDLVDLKAFVTAQAPHYREIKVPVAIVSGDRDATVSTDIHARAIAAALPRGTLTVLPDVGHMVHYASPDRVVEAIDQVAAESGH